MTQKRPRPWRVKVWGGAVCALLTTASLQAGPGVGPNVRVNGPQSPMPDGRLGRAGEAIVSDRTGKLLLAGWESMQGTCGPPFGAACTPPKTPGISAAAYSTDGGKSWTEIGAPYLGDNVMTSGRPWFDRGGKDDQTFFFISRASDARPTPKDAMTPGGAGQIGIVFFRGRFKDGAFTWTDKHLFTPQRPNDLLRSPSLVAAQDGSGKVWVAISPLLEICGLKGGSGGQIEVHRSADEGKTWEGPVVVSKDDFLITPDPKDPLCGSKGTIQLSPSMALGPKGELYITWHFGPKLLTRDPIDLNKTASIHFSRSLDGGKTFSEPRSLAAINSMRENPPVGYSKININDYPRIAVATGGAHRGRVYVTYANALTEATGPVNTQVLVSSQVYLTYSDDQGTTWSKPTPIAPEVPPTGVKRIWPTVAVRDNGTVDIIYMEHQEKPITEDPDDVECDLKTVFNLNRKGKVSGLSDVHWVQSTDGGATFGPPVRVTSETTNWCKVNFDYESTQFANFGDILGLYSTGNRTFAVWPDGRNGVPDAYFAELGAPAEAKPAKTK